MDEITQAPKMFIAVTSEIKKKRKLRNIRIFLYCQLLSINRTLYISSGLKHNIFNEKTSSTQRSFHWNR